MFTESYQIRARTGKFTLIIIQVFAHFWIPVCTLLLQQLNLLKPRRPSSETSEVPNRSQDVPQIDTDVPDLVNPIITKLMDHIIDAKSSEQDVIDNSERFLSRFRKELNNKRECNVQKLSICDYTGDLERTENGIRVFSQGPTNITFTFTCLSFP